MTNTYCGTLGNYGLDFGEVDAVCYARGGAVPRGALVSFCLGRSAEITSDGLTITVDPGVKNSVFASVTSTYTSTDAGSGIFAVALENVADQAAGRFRLRGIVPYAYSVRSNNSSPLSIGGLAIASTSTAGHLEFAHGASSVVSTSTTGKIIALALASITNAAGTSTSTNAVGIPVLFDGINGFQGINIA